MKLVVENGRLVDPARDLDRGGDLLIEGGRVVQVGRPGEFSEIEADRVDATNMIVAPGFFDIHVHLREPGTEEAETIRTGGEAAVAGGFTAVAAMPNTKPVIDNASLVQFIVSEGIRKSPARIFPIGAITVGQAGEQLAEIGEMVEEGIVGISDDGKPVMDARLFRRALEYSRLFDLPVIQHCEDLNLSTGGVMHEGAVSTRLGLKGIPAASEDTIVARDLILTEVTGARYHVAHLSTKGAVEMVRRAKARGMAVTAEVAPHHFTLTEDAVSQYDTNAKMKPPLRTAEDVDACIEGLRDGTIDAIATDHAPHHENLKMLEFDRAPFGITGLETAVGLAFGRLDLPVGKLVSLFSTNPQRIMKIDPWGLFPGSVCDLTIVDPAREWVFDRRQSRSRSRNTPFDGWKLKGKAVTTIVGGRVVYEDR
jgi:dihydroorotase